MPDKPRLDAHETALVAAFYDLAIGREWSHYQKQTADGTVGAIAPVPIPFGDYTAWLDEEGFIGEERGEWLRALRRIDLHWRNSWFEAHEFT